MVGKRFLDWDVSLRGYDMDVYGLVIGDPPQLVVGVRLTAPPDAVESRRTVAFGRSSMQVKPCHVETIASQSADRNRLAEPHCIQHGATGASTRL